MKSIILLYTTLLLFESVSCYAQTCCTGGVPHLGAMRIPHLSKKDIGINFTYILNNNSDIFLSNKSVDDLSIARKVNTLVLQSDYGLSDNLSISLLLPYIFQVERIELDNSNNIYRNFGLGDLSIWANYRYKWDKSSFSVSFGIKLPSGSTNQFDSETNIPLPFSFQNGSGSIDFGFIGFWRFYLDEGKKYNWTNQISVRMNTSGDRFEVHPNYLFGHSARYATALTGSFVLVNRLLDVSSGFNYEYKTKDQFDGGYENINTGGHWINYYLGGNVGISPKLQLSINGNIPVYRKLNGLQLTTSWVIAFGVGYII